MKHHQRNNSRWILWIFAIVCALFASTLVKPSLEQCGMATMALFGIPRRKRAEFNGELDGGGALAEKDFQARVLGNQKVIKSEQEKLLTNFDNLDKETKKTVEELTKVKNNFDNFDSQFKAIDILVKKLQLQLALESRMANGGNTLSLGQRTIRDKETAKQVFAGIARAVGMPEIAAKALGEDSSPGSTMINDALAAEIYDSLLRFGAWATLGVRPVGTKNTKLPIKTARPVANFILTEGGAIADDTAKAGSTVTLEVEVVAVLLNVALQLLEDGELDVVADVLDDFIEAVNFRCDFAAFQGTGTADGTHGGVTGLFNFGTAAVAAATRTTIAATQYEDWLKCLTTVDAAVLTRPARWWMHPTLAAAALGVKDSNGRPIFQTAIEAPQSGGILNMFGFPVTMVGAAPSANAINAKVAVFGDPRAYAVGMRKAFTFEQSEHARWTTLERSFRGHSRFDAVGARASALAVMTLPAA
jgi:HK97 family phage major capsid protein